MFYTVDTQITIESASQITKLRSAVSVRAKKSVHSIVDTGLIELPISSRLRIDGKPQTNSVDTAKQFNEGDKVEILAGHDGELKHEFKGFIKRVDFTDPCKLQLEGYSYQLRKQAPQKSWEKANLIDILKELIKGTDIVIHKDTPKDVTLSPFYMGMKGENGIEVLESLKKTKVLTAYFINGNELYVGGEALALRSESVTHKLGWNTYDDQELLFRRKEDVKVFVSITYTNEKGVKKHTTAGQKGGIQVSYTFGTLSSEDEAKALGLKRAELFRYEGYEGKIKTALVPYCQPGYKDIIEDPIYKERAESVICEGVEFIINDSGDTRIIELGKRINAQA